MGRRAVILGTLMGPGTGQVLAPPSVCLSSWCPGLLQLSSGLRRWWRTGSPGRERAGPWQQPFPGELLTQAIISGTSSWACKEGGFISKWLPRYHLPLPTFGLLPPILPPPRPSSSPQRRSTTALAGDEAVGPLGRQERAVCRYMVCTHTRTRVHTKHTDTVVQQCIRAVRHVCRCMPRTHARRTQRCACLYPDRPARECRPSGPIIEHTASRETSTHRGRLRCQRHAARTCRCPSRTQTLTHTETLVCVFTGVS